MDILQLKEILQMVYMYGFFICFIIALFWTAIFIFCSKVVKPYLGAKFGKYKGLVQDFKKDGTTSLSSLTRFKRLMFDKNGRTFQEFKKFKDDLRPLRYSFLDVPLFMCREGDITAMEVPIDPTEEQIKEMKTKELQLSDNAKIFYKVDMIAPAPLTVDWLDIYSEENALNFIKKNKVLKRKALQFPIWLLFFVIIIIIVVFIALFMFVLPNL